MPAARFVASMLLRSGETFLYELKASLRGLTDNDFILAAKLDRL
jgi:hypothetical protein